MKELKNLWVFEKGSILFKDEKFYPLLAPGKVCKMGKMGSKVSLTLRSFPPVRRTEFHALSRQLPKLVCSFAEDL